MTTLRIALRNYADFENALGEQARLFEAQTPGVSVELVSLRIHDLYNSALNQCGLRDGAYDLALLVTDWLAEGVEAGALEDLQPWHDRAPLPDWPQGWARSLTDPLRFGSKLSSTPWHDGPECLVYRSDLFSNAALRAEFSARHGRELAPPTSWQEFAETARFLTRPEDHLYGTVFAAFPDGHNTLYDFALQVWSRGAEFVGPDGKPRLVAPAIVDALDFYRRVVRDPAICHPRSPSLDSTQSGDLFLSGQVAMMVNWFGFAARSSRAGSPLNDRVAIASIPSTPGCEHISLSVFWALAMGAGSRQKDLAWEFLRFVASPERDFGITRHGTVGTRLSTWRNATLQTEIPPYKDIERISLGARQLPRGPMMAAFASIIDGVIIRSLNTTDSSLAILQDAQQQTDNKGLVLA
jgi:multiple sugar transport system substrate-binding protein